MLVGEVPSVVPPPAKDCMLAVTAWAICCMSRSVAPCGNAAVDVLPVPLPMPPALVSFDAVLSPEIMPVASGGTVSPLDAVPPTAAPG
ncbi:MAG TPA: hypothetical protein VFE41_12140 [Acetobacteraceae bacterium]|jgi:hypothetical protein|nr:hypothetical protein [Acetobacteraceae bacterium]